MTREYTHLVDIADVANQMPPVGTRVVRVPYVYKSEGAAGAHPGTVIYVNYPHLFYVVQFDQNGFREAFRAL